MTLDVLVRKKLSSLKKLNTSCVKSFWGSLQGANNINSNLEQRVAAALVSNLTLRSSVTQTAAWWDESEELAHARIEDSLEHQVEQKLSAASPGGAEESPGRP